MNHRCCNKHNTMNKSKFSRCLVLTFLALASAAGVQAQEPGGALEHTLQRVPVTKHFDHKRFGDHLFIEGGLESNFQIKDRLASGFSYGGAIGDWLTPEHGLRLRIEQGRYGFKGDMPNPKIVSASLDYLLNITAVAHRNYKQPKPLEFYGVAGIEVGASSIGGASRKGVGIHLGLRGQVATGPTTYFFVEPMLSYETDGLGYYKAWDDVRHMASVSAGLGYRLAPWRTAADLKDHDSSRESDCGRYHFVDGTFLTAGGGLQGFIDRNSSHEVSGLGPRVMLGFGKWFTPKHGLRISANYTQPVPAGNETFKAVGGQVEYMVNLHNIFCGVDYSRRWSVNGLLGVSFMHSRFDESGTQRREKTVGAGLGLQGNLRLAPGFSLFIEPRMDVYKDVFSPVNTISSFEFAPSALLGLTYQYDHRNRDLKDAPVEDFTRNYWHDNVFIEGGAGLGLLVRTSKMSDAPSHLQPTAYVGIGKWFKPAHGLRLWGQAGRIESYESGVDTYNYGMVGADYLLNLTHLAGGYRPHKTFEIIAGAGISAMTATGAGMVKPGVSGSLRGSWRVSDLTRLYIEPRLQAYREGAFKYDRSDLPFDLIGSVMAGMTFNLRAYDREASLAAIDAAGGLRNYVSISGGMVVPGDPDQGDFKYGPSFRLGFTHWFTALSAWRTSLGAYAGYRNITHRFMTGTVGFDYMTDLTAHAYGYDPDRVLSVLPYVGVGIGADYAQRKIYFNPDLHAGMQFSLRLTDKLRAHVEGQAAYRLASRLKGGNEYSHAARLAPQLLVGLDYALQRNKRSESATTKPDLSRYVSVGLGSGLYSYTLANVTPSLRKFNLTFEGAYGQWFTGLHGVEVGLSYLFAPGSQDGRFMKSHILSLQADYMLNLRSAITGVDTDNKKFRLTGLAGVAGALRTSPTGGSKIVPALHLALQPSFAINDHMELYARPQFYLYSNKVADSDYAHPFEISARLTVGTKFNF